MIRLILILLFFSMSFSQTTGTTSDGKTVIINDDGTWEIVDKKKEDLNEDFNRNIIMDKFYNNSLKKEKKYSGVVMSIFDFNNNQSMSEDLSHISLITPNGKKVLLNEVFLYLDLFYKDNDSMEDVSFKLTDFESDGINEIVLVSKQLIASCEGSIDIYSNNGGKNDYLITKSLPANCNTFSEGGPFYHTVEQIYGNEEPIENDTILSTGWWIWNISREMDPSYKGGQSSGSKCGYTAPSPRYSSESNRQFNKRLKTDRMAQFAKKYPNNTEFAPYVTLTYRYGTIFHPEKSFEKNTKYFDTLTFIKDEMNMDFIKDDNLDKILCNWYRPLIMNILAYHYNNMKIDTYPLNEENLKNTKRVFYNIYKLESKSQIDQKWEEIVEILNFYAYKKL